MGGGALDYQKLKFFTSYHTGKRYDIHEVGVVQPGLVKTDFLP
jgi:hypothetical protein